MPDRPGQGLPDGTSARLENADPDGRRERAGKLRQVVQRDRQRALPSSSVADASMSLRSPVNSSLTRPKWKPDSSGKGCRRGRSSPRPRSQSGPRRAIIVARRNSTGNASTGRIGSSAAASSTLSCGGTKSSTWNSACRSRRLRVETQLDLPGADARIARQREALMMRAELVPSGRAGAARPRRRPAESPSSAAGPTSPRPCRRAPGRSDGPPRPAGRCRGRYRDSRRPARLRPPADPAVPQVEGGGPTSRS